MNKQEVIEKLKEKRLFFEDDYVGVMTVIDLNDAQKIISQIDEPQKVVIPKFVAEWIEELKKSHSNLAWVWQVYPNEPKVKNWLESNTEKFMRAWLDGYEIEKEKLYTVEIPNPNNEYSMNVLIRLPSSGKIALVALHKPNTSYLKNKEYQLTESEIKQDFEWAWQWAEEVE